MTEKSKDIEQSTENVFLASFFDEVNILTNNYTIYKRILSQCKVNYDKEDEESLSNCDGALKEKIITFCDQCSISIEKIYIQYKTLISIKDIEKNEQIETYYDKLEDQYILHIKDLKSYVIALNTFVAKNIIKDVMQTQTQKASNLF